MTEERGHPKEYDLYTPITPELLELLVRMRDELGSWREVAAAVGTRTRVLRRIHRVELKAVSMTTMDKLCAATGIGHIDEFLWFTADDLVKMGIWDSPKYLEGFVRQTPEAKKRKRAERRRRRTQRKKQLREDAYVEAVRQEVFGVRQGEGGDPPDD